MTYNINKTDGSLLTTIYPLEKNGAVSTPRTVQGALPSYTILSLSGLGTNIIVSGDQTERFPIGTAFEIINSDNNDGTYNVAASPGATYHSGDNETTIPLDVGTLTSGGNLGEVIQNAFIVSGDLTARMVSTYTFDINDSAGSPGQNDGTYTVSSDGSYLIDNNNKTLIFVVQTINGSTSPLGNLTYSVTGVTDLVLFGRGILDFGEDIAENFVKLLENFAGPTAPAAPLVGQLWYDTSGSPIPTLKVYDPIMSPPWSEIVAGSGVGGIEAWSPVIISSATVLVANMGYFIDTSVSPLFEVTLPASPSFGDTVKLKDYASTFDTNNLVVNGNGTDKIEGIESPNTYVSSTFNECVEFTWSGSAQGWKITGLV